MTETTTPRTTTRAAGQRAPVAPARQPSGWVGWIVFAAVMLMIGGVLQAIAGFVALVNDEWVVWSNDEELYLDLTAWGIVHLVIGGIAFLTGIGLLTGNRLAQVVAIVMASVSLVSNFLFLPAYPLWALVVIAIDAFVIYAITAHGDDMRALAGREEIDLR